jgi:outer membrane protein assembly factor BamD (BamD/ComL family)
MKPSVRKYKKGSVIYFAGDVGDKVYVLRKGAVALIRYDYVAEVSDNNQRRIKLVEVREKVKVGEFFGVKSAIGNFPREETVVVLMDSEIVVLSVKAFEELVKKNISIGVKLLVSMSKQLRSIGDKLKKLFGEEQVLPDEEMLKIAKFYKNSGKLGYVKHICKAFFVSYPNSVYREEVKNILREIAELTGDDNLMDEIDKGIYDKETIDVLSEENRIDKEIVSGEEADSGFDDSKDVNIVDKRIPKEFLFNSEYNREDISLDSDEIDFMEEFLSPKKTEKEKVLEELDGDDKDIFDGESSDDTMEGDIEKSFYDGMGAFAHGEYDKALKCFENVITTKVVNGVKEQGLYEKAYIEYARTLIKLRKCKEAIVKLNEFLKKYPNTHEIKHAYYYIALGYECIKKYDIAYKIYSKIERMPPKEDINRLAKTKMRKLEQMV